MTKKGELKLPQIKELAKGLNHILAIKNISSSSRSALIRQIEEKGYKIDHVNNKLVKGRGKVMKAPKPKEIIQPKEKRRKEFIKKSKAGRGVSKADIITSKIALGTGKKAKVSTPPKPKPKPKKKKKQYDEI